MPEKYDAIVIGGGHNGLVNAAYLAKAGKKVLVLERRRLLGGATVTEEVFPGFKYSVFSYVTSLLRPDIIRDLNLPARGLLILPDASSFTPLLDGKYIFRGSDPDFTRRNLAEFSPRDAEAYGEYSREMYFMAKAVKYIIDKMPPDPTSFSPGELLDLLKMAKHFLGLKENHLMTLIKLMTMGSADFLEEWFETDPLIATMSASGIIGTFLGPRSPGTAYVLLHHYMGEVDGAFRAWGFAKGGTGAIANAIADAATDLGVKINTKSPVHKVIVKNGKAKGVVTKSGEEFYADIIVSSLDPQHTFLEFLEEKELPETFLSDVKRYTYRGSSGKVNLALDGAPDFSCLPGAGPHLFGSISISPSVEYIEKAYDQAKYGGLAAHPYIDVLLPSMIDPDMAPPGKHVMSCFVQYAPYELSEGTWDEKREAFGDSVVDTLSEYIPNLKDIILHRQVLTPWDIEQITGLTQGNIFQGELSLSQLFFLRPVAGYAKYNTPIRGYYQCGSSTHPGGGITGGPGKLAAIKILRENT